MSAVLIGCGEQAWSLRAPWPSTKWLLLHSGAPWELSWGSSGQAEL